MTSTVQNGEDITEINIENNIDTGIRRVNDILRKLESTTDISRGFFNYIAEEITNIFPDSAIKVLGTRNNKPQAIIKKNHCKTLNYCIIIMLVFFIIIYCHPNNTCTHFLCNCFIYCLIAIATCLV